MPNFSIATQIRNELNDFNSARVRLATVQHQNDMSVRLLRTNKSGYFFNQREMVTIIDLYYNSKFQNGARDKLGQRKIFMNIGKFRCDVSSKQIDLDTKDFRFVPDDYADPYTAYFMQKDFKVWARDMNDPGDPEAEEGSFGDLVNKCVDNFPRYGTVVLKKVGGKLRFLPLQNLINEQTAKSLQTAAYVIEEHPDMYYYEIQEMAARGWNVAGLAGMKFNEKATVHERYGHVPVKWLKNVMKANGLDESIVTGDDNSSTDALIFAVLNAPGSTSKEAVVLYAAPCKARPYREKHWSRQHGRWLGIGVMEDLVENQEAKNIIVNLSRRSLHWASKRVWQSTTTDMVSKNLVRDVQDGEILEVGVNGQISPVDMTNKALGEFVTFGQDWDKNADQKAFTYEASLLTSGRTTTPFRLGALLTQSAQAFFTRKKQNLGMFLRDAIDDFILPDFVSDMDNKDRVRMLFPGETGFEAVKAGMQQFARTQGSWHTLLSGNVVTGATVAAAGGQYDNARMVLVTIKKGNYKDALYSFDLVVSDDDDVIDVKGLIQTLTTIYQAMIQAQDPRAEKVLERIAGLSGVDVEAFGIPPPKPTPTVSPIQPNANNGGGGADPDAALEAAESRGTTAGY